MQNMTRSSPLSDAALISSDLSDVVGGRKSGSRRSSGQHRSLASRMRYPFLLRLYVVSAKVILFTSLTSVRMFAPFVVSVIIVAGCCAASRMVLARAVASVSVFLIVVAVV